MLNKYKISIIIKMKARHNHFQFDSISTQQRQKKFSRKNGNQSDRSNSSRSDSRQIARFFVRNLKMKEKPDKVNEMINRDIPANKVDWSPPKRAATPSKTDAEKKITFTKQQLIQTQRKQIDHVRQQISKYKVYCQKQNKKLSELTRQNSKLHQQIQQLHNILEEQAFINQELNKQLIELSNQIYQKQTLIDYLQKDLNPSISKIKSSIFQSKINQFQREKEQLNRKIRELEMRTCPGDKEFISASMGELGINDSFGEFGNRPLFSTNQHLQNLQLQLYQAKQQIKRLHISETCTKRKCFQEMQKLKIARDKQYQELKNKFRQFLGKYKNTMKKIFTFQSRNAINKQSDQIQTQISLTLSQDQQHH